MDSDQNFSSTDDALEQKDKEAYASVVDPFLIEALQNPRHRLTGLFLSRFLWLPFFLPEFHLVVVYIF